MRADSYLAVNGYAESRTRASKLISDGKVLLDGRPISKASEEIDGGEHSVEITEAERYVGRGGLKLEGALCTFGVDVKGKRCIDVGASTGGFTDCLLQNGADEVYAVDAGRGQLHEKLKRDRRVVNIEGRNARELLREDLGLFDIAVMDVSFISQTLIHPSLSGVVADGGEFISLIKPQFEAGRDAIGKGGIVKNADDRESAILRVIESAAMWGFELKALMRSPIDGGDGNREYIAQFIKREGAVSVKADLQNIKKLSK